MEIGYLIIFGVGFLFVFITFAIGELFEFGSEIAHEIDAHIDIGTDHGLEAQSPEHTSPSPFSSRIAAVLITAFGGFGYIGSASGWPDLITLLVALVVGFLAAFGVYFVVVKPLAKQQGSTKVDREDFVGLVGQVTTAIPPRGLGKVVVLVPSSHTRVTEAAYALDGADIGFGSRVEVMEVGATGLGVRISNPQN